MPELFWYGGTGNWTDYSNHWSNNSGNSPASPASAAPTSADYVRFDQNSFSGVGQVVTIDAPANCLNMDWTGAAYSPTITGANQLLVYGSLMLTPTLTWSVSGDVGIVWGNSAGSLTSAGITLGSGDLYLTQGAGSVCTLNDDLNIGVKKLTIYRSITATNKTITAGYGIYSNYITARSHNFSDSTIYCGRWQYDGAANITFTAPASITGSNYFYGGGLTYNEATLTGATSTIKGSNFFTELALLAGTTQTITFTDGTTQTAANFALSGSSGHVHTLQGSGTGGWALAKTGGGYTGQDYLAISYGTALPSSTFYAGAHSSDGGHNSGWAFSDLPIAPALATANAEVLAPALSVGQAIAAVVASMTAEGLIPAASSSALAEAMSAVITTLGLVPQAAAGAGIAAATATITAPGGASPSIAAGASLAAIAAIAASYGVAPGLLVTALGRVLAYLEARARLRAELQGGGEE